MNTNERLLKIATANPAVLARIDAVLDGTDGKPNKADADVRLCTFTTAARMLGVSRPTIYRMARLGRLATVRLGGTNRILMRSVFDFANGATC